MAPPDGPGDTGRPGRFAPSIADACRLLLDAAPAAFALTEGATHTLVFSNPAFRELTGATPIAGKPIAELVDLHGLSALLDRAWNETLTFRDELVGRSPDDVASLRCSVWPTPEVSGGRGGLALELRAAATVDFVIDMQRTIAERLLLGALHEKEVGDHAGASHARAAFLVEAGRQLAESVEEKTLRQTISELHLPGDATWCIVDVADDEGALRRLAIVHRDPAKSAAAADLENAWSPEPGDPFGAPAVASSAEPVAITEDIEHALHLAAHDPANLRALHELGIGSVLTVPMRYQRRFMGAITFVGGPRPSYSREDLDLAQELALRSAMALDNARLYGVALDLKVKAQEASRAKSEFLGHMSHELRTPLNAIAGFVDVIDMGIHGPVTPAQRSDLERIRVSQQHLLVMINDILNFMQISGGRLVFHTADHPVRQVVKDAVGLVEPLLATKKLMMDRVTCVPGDLTLRADPDRTQQILINLLTNALKYTPKGGRIAVECEASGTMVNLTVIDDGIGVPADRLEAIFEPFVQLKAGLTEREGGIGLGLSISRDLARAMDGDITAESVPGEGSRFTLSLPRANSVEQAGV